jgi:hypothetical protein
MNPNKKVLVTVLSFVLAMLVIACSCSSLIPIAISQPSGQEAMPGLAGTWQDPDTNDTFVIAWQNGQYVVTSVTWEGTSYSITSQSWNGNSLTWSYSDTDLSLTVTHTTTSISGDSLYANWSYSDGSSGTETLQRGGVSSVTPFVDVTTTPGTQPGVLTSPDSLTVTSADAGVVTSGSGVSITIPAGAVPANDDGSIGSMIFSITEDSTTVPSLPGGYVPVGPVVNLGPEGFVFEQPVLITLPIPSDVDPNTVLGATYYDPGSDTWLLVPGSVDATNRTVEVASTHLSRWSCWGYQETTGEYKDGGYFKVYRPGISVPYKGPDNRVSLASTSHGICIDTITYKDPTVQNWWLATASYTIWAQNNVDILNSVAPSSDAARYWMPYGSYTLTEIYNQSEINMADPLYIPQHYEMFRSLGTFTLGVGQTLEFPDPDPSYNETGWTLGRPSCFGVVTTAVGVGNLQVTLNWNSNADIDLHVIDPGGEEIYYLQPTSSTGGTLDRDNQCDGFVLGQPENIFWTTPPNGTYQVNVNYYEDCGGAGPVNFTVRVCINGNCGNPISGTVNAEGDTDSVTSFSYP